MTVIFFCPNILRDAHSNIFQLKRLEEAGFNIILLDATKFYGNESTATKHIILKNKVECASMEDFITFRKNLPEEPVLFIAFDNYMKFAAPVFHVMIRKEDKLLSYHTKRFSSVDSPSNKMRLLVDKAIVGLDKILPLHYFKSIYSKKLRIYIPDYYLCSTNYLVPTKVYLTVKKKNRIIVHADDVNQIMGKNKSVIDKDKKIGVFLDQGIPFLPRTHPQIYKDSLPSGYLDTYYRNLENTLRRMKESLKLDEIVIALHPDAVRFERELTGKFSGFRMFLGRSEDLVRDAYVVFGHASAAINFAIFYKKPVIILVDKFLMTYNEKVRSFILFYLHELDMKCVNMEKEEHIYPSDINVNEEKYGKYTRKYLKDNNIQENSYFYAIRKIQNDVEKVRS